MFWFFYSNSKKCYFLLFFGFSKQYFFSLGCFSINSYSRLCKSLPFSTRYYFYKTESFQLGSFFFHTQNVHSWKHSSKILLFSICVQVLISSMKKIHSSDFTFEKFNVFLWIIYVYYSVDFFKIYSEYIS